jgi:two-component system sensor histidine kinase KdpD
LENAAKYSPAGTCIEIAARLRNDCVQIDVRDEGIGIAAADLPNVFAKFYRGGMNDAKAAGTGLGLAICRAFVGANDGTIEAISAGISAGSTFRVVLPVAAERPVDSLVAND